MELKVKHAQVKGHFLFKGIQIHFPHDIDDKLFYMNCSYFWSSLI